MRSRLICMVAVLTTAILFVAPFCCRAASDSQAEQLHRYMLLASDFGFSGSVLVARKGNIEINEGFGYSLRETGVRNTASSVFDIGSITKQFTATVIAKLETNGKLSSSDTLAKFFPNVPKDKAAITIRQLLTHTSGIAVYGPGSDYLVIPERNEVEYLFQQPLAFQPGTQSRYSNGDYSLLAYIVDRVSNQPLDQYLRSTFFNQLHMDATGYRSPDNPTALTYEYASDVPFSIALFLPSIDYYGNVFGNGSMLSTTGDLYKWISALVSGRVISVQKLQQMMIPDPMSGYGYGWEIISRNGETVVAHGGLSDFGCNTEIQWTPDGSAVAIVLSNSFPMRGGALPRDMLIGNLLDVAMNKRELSLPDLHFVQDDPLLRRLSGHYLLSNGGKLITHVIDGALVVYPQDQLAIEALGGFDGQTIRRLANETATTTTLLSELEKGQCTTAKLISPSQSLDLCGLFLGHLKQLSQMSGTMPALSVIGSVPSWWERDGSDATFVRITGTDRALFRLHWRNGFFDSIGGQAVENPLETPLRPTSTTTLEGLNVGALNYVRLRVLQNSFELKNVRGTVYTIEPQSKTANAPAVEAHQPPMRLADYGKPGRKESGWKI